MANARIRYSTIWVIKLVSDSIGNAFFFFFLLSLVSRPLKPDIFARIIVYVYVCLDWIHARVTRQAGEPVDGLLTAGDAPSIASLCEGWNRGQRHCRSEREINIRVGEKRPARREGERVSGRGDEERRRETRNSREAGTPLCRRSTLQCRLFEGVFYGEIGEMRSDEDRLYVKRNGAL